LFRVRLIYLKSGARWHKLRAWLRIGSRLISLDEPKISS